MFICSHLYNICVIFLRQYKLINSVVNFCLHAINPDKYFEIGLIEVKSI